VLAPRQNTDVVTGAQLAEAPAREAEFSSDWVKRGCPVRSYTCWRIKGSVAIPSGYKAVMRRHHARDCVGVHVKQKLTVPAEARDLYISSLFRAMRRYAETHADTWYILSAKFGLLSPHQIVSPYELTLVDMTADERKRWATDVSGELLTLLPPGAGVMFLAGERYREHLEPFLTRHGFVVHVPMRGLPIGRQLTFPIVRWANCRCTCLQQGKPFGKRKQPLSPRLLEAFVKLADLLVRVAATDFVVVGYGAKQRVVAERERFVNPFL